MPDTNLGTFATPAYAQAKATEAVAAGIGTHNNAPDAHGLDVLRQTVTGLTGASDRSLTLATAAFMPAIEDLFTGEENPLGAPWRTAPAIPNPIRKTGGKALGPGSGGIGGALTDVLSRTQAITMTVEHDGNRTGEISFLAGYNIATNDHVLVQGGAGGSWVVYSVIGGAYTLLTSVLTATVLGNVPASYDVTVFLTTGKVTVYIGGKYATEAALPVMTLGTYAGIRASGTSGVDAIRIRVTPEGRITSVEGSILAAQILAARGSKLSEDTFSGAENAALTTDETGKNYVPFNNTMPVFKSNELRSPNAGTENAVVAVGAARNVIVYAAGTLRTSGEFGFVQGSTQGAGAGQSRILLVSRNLSNGGELNVRYYNGNAYSTLATVALPKPAVATEESLTMIRQGARIIVRVDGVTRIDTTMPEDWVNAAGVHHIGYMAGGDTGIRYGAVWEALKL